MLDQRTVRDLFSLAEHNSLCAEAMDLFERCLTEGTPLYLEHFVQQQLLVDPPRLDLLVQVAQDVHQRLVSLRESLFDTRARMITQLLDEYGVDLSQFSPSDMQAEFHRLQPHDISAFVARCCTYSTPIDLSALDRLVRTVLLTAAQLNGDIQMTQHLLDFILDWTDSLSTTSLRHMWHNTWEPLSSPHVH